MHQVLKYSDSDHIYFEMPPQQMVEEKYGIWCRKGKQEVGTFGTGKMQVGT